MVLKEKKSLLDDNGQAIGLLFLFILAAAGFIYLCVYEINYYGKLPALRAEAKANWETEMKNIRPLPGVNYIDCYFFSKGGRSSLEYNYSTNLDSSYVLEYYGREFGKKGWIYKETAYRNGFSDEHNIVESLYEKNIYKLYLVHYTKNGSGFFYIKFSVEF